jgi:hypothetical protein
LQFRKRSKLCEQIRRGVEKNPVVVAAGYRYRGLSSRPRFESSLADAITVGTVTVPLGEPSASR